VPGGLRPAPRCGPPTFSTTCSSGLDTQLHRKGLLRSIPAGRQLQRFVLGAPATNRGIAAWNWFPEGTPGPNSWASTARYLPTTHSGRRLPATVGAGRWQEDMLAYWPSVFPVDTVLKRALPSTEHGGHTLKNLGCRCPASGGSPTASMIRRHDKTWRNGPRNPVSVQSRTNRLRARHRSDRYGRPTSGPPRSISYLQGPRRCAWRHAFHRSRPCGDPPVAPSRLASVVTANRPNSAGGYVPGDQRWAGDQRHLLRQAISSDGCVDTSPVVDW